VISGTFYMGMGDKLDEAATKELPTGSFVVMPAKQSHFAMAKGETVVQLHGIGAVGHHLREPCRRSALQGRGEIGTSRSTDTKSNSTTASPQTYRSRTDAFLRVPPRRAAAKNYWANS